jgi:hypothetical protein
MPLAHPVELLLRQPNPWLAFFVDRHALAE